MEAIQLNYIEVPKSVKILSRKPPTELTSLRIKPEIKDTLAEISELTGIPRNKLIIKAVHNFLAESHPEMRYSRKAKPREV